MYYAFVMLIVVVFIVCSLQIVQLLHDGGLTTYVFKSVQEDELIVKVRASLDRLKTQADMIGKHVQSQCIKRKLSSC